MIAIEKKVFGRLNLFLSLRPEILRFGAMDGSVIWEAFGEEGFRLVMNQVPMEAANHPEHYQVMKGWSCGQLTPFPIMKCVIEKLIARGEIVIEE